MNPVYSNFFGIDIGKDEFVSNLKTSDKTNTYKNSKTGFNDFFKVHKAELKNSFVVLETTGGYESAFIDFLFDKKIALHRADTRKVKNFIRSFGQLAKTDSLDAKALSLYGFKRHQDLSLFKRPSKAEQELKLLVERRRDLKTMLVQEKNRLQAPLNKSLKPSINAVIRCLENQVNKLETKIDSIVSNCEILSRKKEILRSVPGIGELTAANLLGMLPELGQLNRKEIASLCGLAPYARQSGGKSHYQRTYGGRRNLRPLLYMAAMGARRQKNGPLAAFFERLTANGKKPLVALVAVMRKIVVIANARIREEFYC